MKKPKKLDTLDFEMAVWRYISDTVCATGSQKQAIEYIISQFIYLLADSTKLKQDEALKGFECHLKEL